MASTELQSKNRITDDIHPFFHIVNVLSFNQLSTKCGTMKHDELVIAHSALVIDWCDTIFMKKYEYLNIPTEVTADKLKSYVRGVKNDELLLRRAKESVSLIINKCNPLWTPQSEWPSGKKLADMIRKIIEALWEQKEEDKCFYLQDWP